MSHRIADDDPNRGAKLFVLASFAQILNHLIDHPDAAENINKTYETHKKQTKDSEEAHGQ